MFVHSNTIYLNHFIVNGFFFSFFRYESSQKVTKLYVRVWLNVESRAIHIVFI